MKEEEIEKEITFKTCFETLQAKTFSREIFGVKLTLISRIFRLVTENVVSYSVIQVTEFQDW